VAPGLTLDASEVASWLSRAERAVPSFRRLELTIGNVSVAFLPRPDRTLMFARSGSGEAALRRFRYEVTQLAHWWGSELALVT
jgi:hypothetical protein